MSSLIEILPDTAEAFGKLRDSILEGGDLDRKTKDLIAVASSVHYFSLISIILKIHAPDTLFYAMLQIASPILNN